MQTAEARALAARRAAAASIMYHPNILFIIFVFIQEGWETGRSTLLFTVLVGCCQFSRSDARVGCDGY